MSEEGQESRENVILGPDGTGHAEKSANIVEDLVNLERKTAYSQLEGLAQTLKILVWEQREHFVWKVLLKAVPAM